MDADQIDSRLAAALRHAPDHDAAPPASLDQTILARARAATKPPSWWRGFYRHRWSGIDGLLQPAPAAAFVTLVLGTVIGVMWHGEPPAEAIPGAPAEVAQAPMTTAAPRKATQDAAPAVLASPPPVVAEASPPRAVKADAAPVREKRETLRATAPVVTTHTATAAAPLREAPAQQAAVQAAPALGSARTDAAEPAAKEAGAAVASVSAPAPPARSVAATPAPPPTTSSTTSRTASPAPPIAASEKARSFPTVLDATSPRGEAAPAMARRLAADAVSFDPLATVIAALDTSDPRVATLRELQQATLGHWRRVDTVSTAPSISLSNRSGSPLGSLRFDDAAVWWLPAAATLHSGASWRATLAPARVAALRGRLDGAQQEPIKDSPGKPQQTPQN